MNQIAITFDQHRLVEQLIEAEMPKKQAEIFASTLHNLDVANKSDIEGVRGELQTQINGAKNDSAGARADNTNLKAHTDGKFEAVDGKFEAGEAKIDALRVDVQAGFKAVDGRFEATDAKIDALRVEMQVGFKAVDGKFETLRAEMQAGFKDSENRLIRFVSLLAGLIIGAVGLMQYFF